MALNPNTNPTMAGRITAVNADYPYASAKDETLPGAGDGTPYFKARADDIFGFQQALLKLADIVPSGNAETVLASQYTQALVELVSGRAFNYDESGIADVYVFDVRSNQQSPQSLFDDLQANAVVGNPNTGACTVDVAGLGAKSIKTSAGVDPAAGDVSGRIELLFDFANDWWELIPVVVSDTLKVDLKSGRKNVIINGDFDIWQRAVSQTSNGYGSDDRWVNEHNGSTKVASRQTFILGQTDVPGNPKYFSRTVVTSVGGAGNFVRKTERIEGVKSFAGETITLSFYGDTDSAKDIATELVQNFGTGGSPSSEVTAIGVTTHAITTTFSRFDIQVAVPSISGKTLGSNNDDYLEIVFWFDAGSSFDARTDTLGQQSGTFDISNVQIEKGSFATDFEQRQIADELALCKRYYETGYFNTRAYVAAVQATESIQWSVEKRSVPAIVLSATNDLDGSSPTSSTPQYMECLSTAGVGEKNMSANYSADAEL